VTPAPAALSAGADRLARQLAEPPHADSGWQRQSLSKGAAGVAILHGARAQAGHGSLRLAHAWLSHAAEGGITEGAGTGLWFGAPAIAFAMAAAAPGHYREASRALKPVIDDMTRRRLHAARDRLDAGARPSTGEYDLVRGLTGLGACLLHCDPDPGLLRQVLRYLVRLTEPVPASDAAGHAAPGWWSSSNPNLTTSTPGGHGNFGMAHGIAGPVALLALAARHGITVPGQADAIDQICDWLATWRQPGPAGPWWPAWITVAELRDGTPSRPGPGRPSWCYGTPGIARAMQLAALARHDQARQAEAENALARCVTDPNQATLLSDPGLCHGWAGATAATWHAARDAGAEAASLGTAVSTLAGVLASSVDVDHPCGLIDGYAGVALTLHDLAIQAPGTWARCLLLT
jgi:lantibiotic biosynthesis protein